ncbi:hypothetical protein B0H13DRAFT_589853 [Mycena leptocephala]|nr:hypothetical protein B0H13DRAFT_589853 [Mycena leptocephala]
MSLIDAYRLHISGGTFNEIQRLQQNEYHVGGDLVQRHGENGINILHRNIARDAFYNSEQRFPPPQCHPNTRTAVQDTIQCWGAEADQLQAPSVMWLYGPAGAGKSAVAQTMAEKWATEDALAAAFFFGRWRAGGSSGERLFPTIAYQLALHVSALRNAIALAVEADPAICDKAMEEQARALIVNPLRDLDIPPARPYAVIIDGLDECNDKSMQARIVKIIFQIFFENKLPLRFLICSRPEPYIREAFESLPPHAHFRRLVLDETFNPGRDILTYLRDRFSDIQMRRLPNYFGSWPTERDLDKLVHNASGQFIYPATVIKFVDDEYCHPMEQLQLVLSLYTDHRSTSPLADLDTLYTFILSVNPNTSLLVRILGTYFAIPNPDDNRTHSISFLDNILGVAPGSVRSALRGLHSLLFMADSDTYRIRLHHASLHDFLFNPNRAGRFFLDITQHHRDLAARCFSIVLANFQSPQQYSPESHFHWENHYRSEWEHRSAIQSCLEHFRHSLRPPRVASLCQDAEVMTLRFIGMIDFLNSLEKMLNVGFAIASPS